MISTVISLIQASAPYALLCLAGLCLAATLIAERRRQKADAGKKASVQSFGIWPDAEETPLGLGRRSLLLPAVKIRRLTLGPARISSGEAGPLFFKASDRRAYR